MKEIITNLNKVFSNRIRLGIMSILVVNDWVDFKTLKEMLDASDGNLATHLSALEKKQFIQIRKAFVGKKPQTSYSISDSGRKAFKEHLDALEELIKKSS